MTCSKPGGMKWTGLTGRDGARTEGREGMQREALSEATARFELVLEPVVAEEGKRD